VINLDRRLRDAEAAAQLASAADTHRAGLNAFRRAQAYLRRRLRAAIVNEPEASEPARLLEACEQNWWHRSGMLGPGAALPDWDDRRFVLDLTRLKAYTEQHNGGLPRGDHFDEWWPSWSADLTWHRPPSFPWAAASTAQIAAHFKAAVQRDPVLAPMATGNPVYSETR
jgi:hypothetical protein